MNPNHPTLTDRRPTLASSLKALPRPVWILFAGTFINKFGAFVVPFLAIYLTRQGYSVGQAALAIGAYGVGNLVASILGGHMADKFGRRKTIVFSMFSGAIAMLLLSQAHSLPLIIALTGLVGLTGELYRPACSALLADLTPPGQRITAFATYRVAFNAGFAFGPAMAGFLAAHGFFWLFLGDALTSMLFGLVAWFALPHGVRSEQGDATWTEALAVLRHDRRLHQVLLANLAIGLVFFQIASTFSLHVTQLGFSTAVYGAIFSLNGALVMICELPLIMITRRFPARRVMALGYVLVGIGYVLNAFAHGIPALVLCMAVFTFGEMLTMPVSAAFVADLAPAHMRGRYLGASGLTWATALIIGPGMGLKLYAFNTVIYWVACGGLGLLAAGIILVRTKSEFASGGPKPEV
jgi:MFS family permease